jgi:hypothetical protein
LDDGSSKATPEPHLVRFLKPDERALVEPVIKKVRNININPLLLAATPLPEAEIKTKETGTEENNSSEVTREESPKPKDDGSEQKPTMSIEKKKAPNLGKPLKSAVKKPKAVLTDEKLDGED